MLTVLVADDSAHLRELVRITLSSQGWRVVETGEATAVLELVKTSKPDAILLDIVFENAAKDVDGFKICRDLKADPATTAIPVVMLSARDKATDVEAGKAAGAATYLRKPFGPIELIDAIKNVLHLK